MNSHRCLFQNSSSGFLDLDPVSRGARTNKQTTKQSWKNMYLLKKTFMLSTAYSKTALHNSLKVSSGAEWNVGLYSFLKRQFSLKSKLQEQAQQDDQYLSQVGIDSITKGDKELEYKLKVIMLETEVFRQEGKSVPPSEFMNPELWENLLNLSSRNARKKYLDYLFSLHMKKLNDQAKKLEKRKQHELAVARQEEIPKNLPVEEHARHYGLMHNNIFIRFHDPTINHFYNSRLIQAMQFGQKLVIDCGYDQHMTKRENLNTAKQLMLLFSENRIHKEPFDVHYTSLRKGSEIEIGLHKNIPTVYDKDFPLNVHEQSYLNLFPKENLVYLTPHCREEMCEFDHDAIYIVGGIVDKSNQDPISLAKAKREGLRMQKFPLDKYLSWGPGSGKSLTINQCVAILLDLKATGNWNYALRHVPKRKLMSSEEASFKPQRKENNKFSYNQSARGKENWRPKNSDPNSIRSSRNIKSLFVE